MYYLSYSNTQQMCTFNLIWLWCCSEATTAFFNDIGISWSFDLKYNHCIYCIGKIKAFDGQKKGESCQCKKKIFKFAWRYLGMPLTRLTAFLLGLIFQCWMFRRSSRWNLKSSLTIFCCHCSCYCCWKQQIQYKIYKLVKCQIEQYWLNLRRFHKIVPTCKIVYSIFSLLSRK